ncbi:MAG: TatD family hydrolase [Deltaproteobacteria bacterium]|nr:TatD family hydrolase [Deltaproteobacteria bacterium]
MIDAHCHLTFEPLTGSLNAVLQNARGAGVSAIVSCAYAPSDWSLQAGLAAEEGVFIAQGVHPWAADSSWDEQALRRHLARSNCVAVGEVGLDYGPGRPPRASQRETFKRQLRIAEDLGLPLVLHCYRAFDDLFAMLDEHHDVGGMLHGYTRGPELAERLATRGLLVSFGAAVTRKGARRCREAASVLPLSKILVESDAPSRWPSGVTSTPSLVGDVVAELASLRGEDVSTLAMETSKNARRLFAIDQ